MSYHYNDGSATDRSVKKLIPILIMWARYEWDVEHSYTDVANAVGYAGPRPVGKLLGAVSDALHQMCPDAPTLNALVMSKGKGVPGDSFNYAVKEYDASMSRSEKMTFAKGKNQIAHEYDWEPVLHTLNLRMPPLTSPNRIEKIRKTISSYQGHVKGEGAGHRALKNYVLGHPEEFNIGNVLYSTTEHVLLSGDRIDVYFETADCVVAVEVKSSVSDETDIIRGLFQTVKYKAVLEAERMAKEKYLPVHTILVLGGSLSKYAREIAHTLVKRPADLSRFVYENIVVNESLLLSPQ